MCFLPDFTIDACRSRLKQMKSDLLNQRRVRRDPEYQQIVEIELALARIERGGYGLCEETEEPIEIERLLAVPYTRLSVRGCEIRRNHARRRAE